MPARQDDDDDAMLIGIVNTSRDLRLLVDQGWYRVPVQSAPSPWPPQWFAAYETVGVAGGVQTIEKYAWIRDIEIRTREELFPGEAPGSRAGTRYYKLILGPVLNRAQPIQPSRPRRSPFLRSTLGRFKRAQTINDLFWGSPLEETLWEELKRQFVPAEREWREDVDGQHFYLDFAVFCQAGKVDVEVDGVTYHWNRERTRRDKDRNNRLNSLGWNVLRWETPELRETMDDCIAQLKRTISSNGGLASGFEAPIRIPRRGRAPAAQQPLF